MNCCDVDDELVHQVGSLLGYIVPEQKWWNTVQVIISILSGGGGCLGFKVGVGHLGFKLGFTLRVVGSDRV